VIIETPVSNPPANIQLKNINVVLSSIDAVVEADILWRGSQHQYARPVAMELTPEEQEKWITGMLEVPYVFINKYSFDTSELLSDKVELNMEMVLPKYASRSGDRLFFNPNLIERRTSAPKENSQRRSPVSLRYPYLDVDSVHYTIPADYQIESIPTEVNLETSFAEYTSKAVADGDSVIIHVRKLEVKEYSVPAENYPEYRKFFSEVVKADKNQIVLIRKNKN
ncbi:MAG: hypothetical protein R6W90_10740, partial [Ignavibacteriaceae bacterium]